MVISSGNARLMIRILNHFISIPPSVVTIATTILNDLGGIHSLLIDVWKAADCCTQELLSSGSPMLVSSSGSESEEKFSFRGTYQESPSLHPISSPPSFGHSSPLPWLANVLLFRWGIGIVVVAGAFGTAADVVVGGVRLTGRMSSRRALQ